MASDKHIQNAADKVCSLEKEIGSFLGAPFQVTQNYVSYKILQDTYENL